MPDYYQKYRKYKRKYLKEKVARNEIPDKDIYKKYDTGVKSFLNYNTQEDPETAHQAEDSLMKDFIFDIASGRITDMETVESIAKLIKKVNDLDYTRWYA